MALTVETGAGLPNADAFIDIAFADSYFNAVDGTKWTGSTEHKEQSIRRATSLLSTAYNWAGLRTHARNQALAWPRAGVTDAELNSISKDEIPIELKKACAELAAAELATPGVMTPTVVQAELVKREKVGSIEVEYANISTGPNAWRPVLTVVSDLIGQFMAVTGATSISGRVARG